MRFYKNFNSQDFIHYKKGIYDPTTTHYLGYRAVRIIGWGEGPDTNGVSQPYWIVANSWSTVCFIEIK